MDLDNMLKQAQKLQEDMEAIQKKLEEEVIEVSGDRVKIYITGSNEFKSVEIDETLIKEGKDALETAVLAACQKAVKAAREQHEKAMKDITSGLELPSLDEIQDLGDSGPKRRTDTDGPGIQV